MKPLRRPGDFDRLEDPITSAHSLSRSSSSSARRCRHAKMANRLTHVDGCDGDADGRKNPVAMTLIGARPKKAGSVRTSRWQRGGTPSSVTTTQRYSLAAARLETRRREVFAHATLMKNKRDQENERMFTVCSAGTLGKAASTGDERAKAAKFASEIDGDETEESKAAYLEALERLEPTATLSLFNRLAAASGRYVRVGHMHDRIKYTRTKYTEQNISGKYIPDKIYQTKGPGQNIPGNMCRTKFAEQIILDNKHLIVADRLDVRR